MAGDGDDVFRREDRRLIQDVAPHFREGEAVFCGIKSIEPAGDLDGLEGDAADAGLFEGEIDDLADLVVIDAALEGDDEGGGDVVFVEAVEGFLADIAQVFAAKGLERLGTERIKIAGKAQSRAYTAARRGTKAGSRASLMPLVLSMRCLMGPLRSWPCRGF